MEETPSPQVRIFVSHSHADNAFCQRLVEALRARYGTEAVWFDASGGLEGGDEWWTKIRTELRARPIFISVLSPEAMASRWVNDEITLAWSQRNQADGKFIIPVLARECKVRDDLGTIREKVSFLPPRTFEQGMADLLKRLGVIERELVKRALPPAPKPERRPQPPRAVLASVAALVLVALLGGLLATHRPQGSAQANQHGGPTATSRPPTATPTITPNSGATATAIYNLSYVEASPGPCSAEPDAWRAVNYANGMAPKITSLDQMNSQNLTAAYLCTSGGLQVAARTFTSGSSAGASFDFIGKAGNLPTQNTYQITVAGFNLNQTAYHSIYLYTDRCSFNISSGYYSVYQRQDYPRNGSPTPTQLPYLGGPVDLTGGNFTVAIHSDGQRVTFQINGYTLQTVQLVAPVQGNDSGFSLAFNTQDSAIETVTFSNFHFDAHA